MYILNRNEEIVAILSGNADDSGCHFFNSTLTLEINKGASLVFEVDTTESDIVQHIKEENMVVVNDGETFRLLIIKEVSDVHDSDYIKEVYCEDASIELIDEVITEEVSGKVEMGIVLADLLEGTRWSIGEVDNTYIRNVNSEFKLKSVLNGIQSLAKQYDAEIDFTVEFAGNRIVKRKVNMKKSFGRALGKRFEFGKDVTSIKRTVNTSDIKTAIIPFGKPNEETGESLTIQGISWATPTNPMNKPLGQIYLEDTEATALWGYKGIDSNKRPRWVAITFEECEDANELLSLAHLQLNRFNKPKISYEANVIDLFRMTGDDSYSFEKVGLGDLVNVIDHNFAPALALSSRVVKLELDLNDTSNSVVTLGTIVESIVDKDLKTQIEELNVKVGAVASTVDLSDIEDRLDSLESETGTGHWEQIQEVNNLLFGNGVGYHYMSEDNGIWVFDKPANQNPTKAVALKGGMIGLAKYDSQKQVWNVGTFIDGNSVNASMITTGTLKADRIEAGALTVKHFNQELKSIINSVGNKPSREEVTTSIQTAVDNITLSVKSTYATKSETESAKTSAITESKKYSDIKKGEAISEAVQSSNSYTNEKKAEAISEAVTDANEYSDAKKDEAVAEAGKDAQAKADAVKTILTKQIELKAEKTDVYTKSQTYSKSETDSKIQVAKESIELSVSGTYETKSNVENKVSTAKSEAILSAVSTSKSYADTKKAEAITQAGKDADSKVATAKTELNGKIDLKASKTDVYTKTETYTKAQTDSAIKIAKDSIELGVKNTYETKTNVENKISNAVNNVQVGGTNFATDTNKGVTGWNWGLQTGGKTITEVTENGIRCCKIVRDAVASTGWSYISYNKIGRNKYLPNRKYTVSFEVKSSVPTTFYCAFTEGNGLNRMDTTNTKATVSEANKWTKLNFTVTMKDTLPSSTSQVLYLSGMDSGTGVTYIFRNLIITEGTKASSWSPAPEDVDLAIDKKANAVDVYKKSEVYTRTETDSAIKVAKDSINLGVSNTYETKTNVENKITSVSNSLTGKIDAIQVGGRNLAKNSMIVVFGGTLDKGDYISSGTLISTVNGTSQGFRFDSQSIYEANQQYVLSFCIQKQSGTINQLGMTHNGKSHKDIKVVCDGVSKGDFSQANTSVGAIMNDGNVHKIEVYFTTSSDIPADSGVAYTYIQLNKATGTPCSAKITKFKLEKGTKATDWSPAPEDINSAIDKKANSTDVYTKTETYTKAQTDSAIKVAKDEINLGVKNTYETKSNVETKVNTTKTELNTKIDGIQVGGKNILRCSNFKNNNTSYGWNNFSGKVVDGYLGEKAVNIDNSTATSGYIDRLGQIIHQNSGNKMMEASQWYTLSFYAKGSGTVRSHIYPSIIDASVKGFADNNEMLLADNGHLDWKLTNEWVRHTYTFKTKASIPSVAQNLLFRVLFASNVFICMPQLEMGTKASAYTIAPEDVQESIDLKANTADVYKKTETYTKSETDSKIKVAKDNIELGVKNTYETKTNVETKVNNAVNNIQVGGRNLILNSALNGNKNWTGTVTIDTSKKYENCNSLKYTGTASSYSSSTPAKVGDVFTISLKSFVGTSGGNLPLIIFEEYKDNTTTRIKYQETTVSSTLNSWQPYTKTWTVKNSETTNVRIRIYNRTASYNFWVSQPKLERGTKATDWSPAPEDVDSAIGTKANSNDVYKKTEVYTKAETNSQINVAKDSITNTVSKSYLSKSDATNTYATKSSLTQTTNNITAKFEASGGYNLLQNSGFKTGDISRWWIHQHNSPTGSCGVLNSSATWGFPDSSVNCCQIKMTNQSGKEYGIAQNASTTTGKRYTISLYYAGHRVSSANIIVRSSDGKWVANKSFNPSAKTGGNSNISNWGSISLTFTATQPSHTINLVLNSAENDGYFWIAKPQIVEGEVALPYSPHPNEIYTGSTVIDASGVTINNGAIKVKNNAGTTVLEGDSAGNLTLNGTIRSESSSGRYVSLNSGGVTFKDSRKSEEVLRMATSYHTNRDINGVTVALPQYGDFLGFKHIAKPSLENGWNSNDTTYNFMDLWSTDYNDSGGFKFYKGINVFAPTYYNQRIRFRNGSSQYLHEITPNITWNSLGGLMGIYGDNGAVLGYKSADALNARIVVTEENHPGTDDVIKSWGHWNCSGYIVHNATFRGNHENSYSNTVARAYSKTSGIEAEEKQVRFNFENVQIKEGRAVLSVPKRYAGINNGYVVSSIVKKGKGDVWVAEEQENRFTIEADADIKVNVEIIIKMSEVASYSVRTTPENARCFDTSTGQLIEK